MSAGIHMPVSKLTAQGDADPSSLAEHLNDLEKKGWLQRPAAWDWPRPVDAAATVRVAVTREREEGW